MTLSVKQQVRHALVRRVAETATTHDLFRRGEHLLVATSGGPDSTAVLSVLCALAPAWTLVVSAVHFNYGLRGAESDGDARFVGEVCDRLGARLVSEQIDLSRASSGCRTASLQEAARDARYAAMRRIAASLGANKIALGHTADDQAETLLMWMLRGSGVAGLSGIPLVRESVFVRPLLEATRAEILAYLKAEHLAFREDSSNATSFYLRNRVRHELMPALKRFNPAVVQVLKRQAQILHDEERWLNQVTDEHLSQLTRPDGTGAFVLDRIQFVVLPVALQRRLLRMAVRRTSGRVKGPAFGAVGALLARVVHGRSGSSLVVQGVEVRRDYDRLRVRRTEPPVEGVRASGCGEMPLPVPSTQCWSPTGQLIRVSLVHSGVGDEQEIVKPSPMMAVIDADRLSAPLVVRAWKPGDRFQPYGMRGRTKKLQDYFTDIKLSRDERVRVPIVVAPEGIVWVAGHRMDHRFCVTSETRRCWTMELVDPTHGQEGA